MKSTGVHDKHQYTYSKKCSARDCEKLKKIWLATMDVLLALSIPVFIHTRWTQQERGGETALRWPVPD